MDAAGLDVTIDARILAGLGGRWYGLHPALVTDLADPDRQGRVKVTLPWSPDPGGARYEAWARFATLLAGADRGAWMLPDVGDEVVVGFEAGDPRRPYVLGALWNGSDAPPATMDAAGRNDRKVLRTRSGIQITLDDTSGGVTLVLETPGGQKITLADTPGSIEAVDASGNSVRVEASGITIVAAAKVTVQAASLEVTAGTVTVNAGMSKFSGVVQADTVIATSVVGTSYTPGAGNIW